MHLVSISTRYLDSTHLVIRSQYANWLQSGAGRLANKQGASQVKGSNAVDGLHSFFAREDLLLLRCGHTVQIALHLLKSNHNASQFTTRCRVAEV